MKVLIVCATKKEVLTFFKRKKRFDFLVTGVGMVATTFQMAKHLSEKKYDLVLNVGIAGSFNKEIEKCEVVNVTEDRFADLGAEDRERFIDVFEMGLESKNKFPFKNGVIKSASAINLKTLLDLRTVKGITVNRVHGNEKSISKIKSKYSPDIETMEGAACFYVCAFWKIPCVQVRSISNYIEKRNRNNWDIEGAVKSLNIFIQKFLDELSDNR